MMNTIIQYVVRIWWGPIQYLKVRPLRCFPTVRRHSFPSSRELYVKQPKEKRRRGGEERVWCYVRVGLGLVWSWWKSVYQTGLAGHQYNVWVSGLFLSKASFLDPINLPPNCSSAAVWHYETNCEEKTVWEDGNIRLETCLLRFLMMRIWDATLRLSIYHCSCNWTLLRNICHITMPE